MTTLRISITKEVLEATKDCLKDAKIKENCAIAYAIREIFPEATVGIYYIRFNRNSGVPHHQEAFILTFDLATPAERASMQPFSFDIRVPDEIINEINIEEIRDIIKNSKILELYETI